VSETREWTFHLLANVTLLYKIVDEDAHRYKIENDVV